ncbi:hypothetical protein B0T20DRAFT_111176 [Sordaria brevicollis]|uniref:Uncharacterized protein n=1 Tax=Sordaria brevicollis TaxID=83679 RepID=A0AAE0NRE8_SORBR|nr:hypothetical protein B0T20DRAFT_111176 [Sordaria brevicollis]
MRNASPMQNQGHNVWALKLNPRHPMFAKHHGWATPHSGPPCHISKHGHHTYFHRPSHRKQATHNWAVNHFPFCQKKEPQFVIARARRRLRLSIHRTAEWVFTPASCNVRHHLRQAVMTPGYHRYHCSGDRPVTYGPVQPQCNHIQGGAAAWLGDRSRAWNNSNLDGQLCRQPHVSLIHCRLLMSTSSASSVHVGASRASRTLLLSHPHCDTRLSNHSTGCVSSQVTSLRLPHDLRASTHLIPEAQRVGGGQGKAQQTLACSYSSLLCIFFRVGHFAFYTPWASKDPSLSFIILICHTHLRVCTVYIEWSFFYRRCLSFLPGVWGLHF